MAPAGLRWIVMANVEKELNAASRDLVADAARLQEIEAQKATQTPSDPKLLSSR